MKNKILIPSLIIILLAVMAWPNRVLLMYYILGLVDGTPALYEKSDEPENVTWYDDYFTYEYIDEKTIAIGEPRYWQVNYNYLILGEERAILFDSGPGVRDIRPLVEQLTSLPVTVVASHLHYDHVGNHNKFDSIAMIDLPSTRARANGNNIQTSSFQHLGFFEGIDNSPMAISEWWQHGQIVDIGGRKLTVLNTPGHTVESLMLWDEKHNHLFAGDYIYDGELYAMLPDSDLMAYEQTAETLLGIINQNTGLLTAHRESALGAPILVKGDLADLHSILKKINNGKLEGEGWFTKTYPVNDRLRLLTQ